jgi:hypothetical protein
MHALKRDCHDSVSTDLYQPASSKSVTPAAGNVDASVEVQQMPSVLQLLYQLQCMFNAPASTASGPGSQPRQCCLTLLSSERLA